MSLFRDLGRRVERLKQQVDEAESETASHECADCGRSLHAEHDECPDCGCDEIVEQS